MISTLQKQQINLKLYRLHLSLGNTWVLAQAECDAVLASRVGDDMDTSDRIKHLFWKYLPLESYRKALVWQKRYLLLVLGGYQEAEATSVSRLAQLSVVQEAILYRQLSVPQKKAKT